MSTARRCRIALGPPAIVYAASTSGCAPTASRTSSPDIRPSQKSSTKAWVFQPIAEGSTFAE